MEKVFYVLVTGGRSYDNAVEVQRALDSVYARHGLPCVIHGAARGADSLAELWAKRVGARTMAFPADWKRHGLSAGPLRNQQMVDFQPDLVVAFPGGRGTADLVKKARQAGIAVEEWGGA